MAATPTNAAIIAMIDNRLALGDMDASLMRIVRVLIQSITRRLETCNSLPEILGRGKTAQVIVWRRQTL
jgi:hypothetical protein